MPPDIASILGGPGGPEGIIQAMMQDMLSGPLGPGGPMISAGPGGPDIRTSISIQPFHDDEDDDDHDDGDYSQIPPEILNMMHLTNTISARPQISFGGPGIRIVGGGMPGPFGLPPMMFGGAPR